MSELLTVYTVGHSTRTTDELLQLLAAVRTDLLADIRRYPGSRRNPEMGRGALECRLAEAGMGYLHMESLGGRRRVAPESTNGAWRNPAFRAYADHMQTEEFCKALEELMAEASQRRVVVLCSEALPWRCHRNLVADALVARGASVRHLFAGGVLKEHALTPFACVRDGRVLYPAAEEGTSGRDTVPST